MEENQDQKIRREEPAQAKKAEEKIPYCTVAASAEHARGALEEEPCDDSRAGDDERE